MVQVVNWDYITRRPIVGGQVEDPETGELRKAGPFFYPGPPAVRFILNRVNEPWDLSAGSLEFDTIDSAFRWLRNACVKFPGIQVTNITASEFYFHFSYSSSDSSFDLNQVWRVLSEGHQNTTEVFELPGPREPSSNVINVETTWLNCTGATFFNLQHTVRVSNMKDVVMGVARLLDNSIETPEKGFSLNCISVMNERLSVVCETKMRAHELRTIIDGW